MGKRLVPAELPVEYSMALSVWGGKGSPHTLARNTAWDVHLSSTLTVPPPNSLPGIKCKGSNWAGDEGRGRGEVHWFSGLMSVGNWQLRTGPREANSASRPQHTLPCP